MTRKRIVHVLFVLWVLTGLTLIVYIAKRHSPSWTSYHNYRFAEAPGGIYVEECRGWHEVLRGVSYAENVARQQAGPRVLVESHHVVHERDLFATWEDRCYGAVPFVWCREIPVNEHGYAGPSLACSQPALDPRVWSVGPDGAKTFGPRPAP